jgi:hypothetical protein
MTVAQVAVNITMSVGNGAERILSIAGPGSRRFRRGENR